MTDVLREPTMNDYGSTLFRLLRLGTAPALASALLVACGGGGDGGGSANSASVASAEGAWQGTLSGSSSQAFQMLMLEDGEFWTLYGTPSGGRFLVAGFVQGNVGVSGSNLQSSNAKDFGTDPGMATQVTTRFTGDTLSGSVAYPGSTVELNGSRIPATQFDYQATAKLSTIAGSCNLTALDGNAVVINIAGNGAFTANASGCPITGTLLPRPTGRNVFDLRLNFGPAPCLRPGQSGRGIAVAYPLATGPTQLIIAGVDASRTSGTALFGTR